jgi:thiamine pyrophosphokinase
VNEVLFFGVLGGRLDLTLANLMLLARDEWEPMSLIVNAEPDVAYLLRDHDRIAIDGNPGDTISLIPLSERVTEVTTQSLRWQLDKDDLYLGNTLSVSNELLGTTARVQIGKGKMLLVHRTMLAANGEE